MLFFWDYILFIMIKKRKFKLLYLIIIITSVTIFAIYYIYNYSLRKYENYLIENFFETNFNNNTENINNKIQSPNHYIGVLEIPKINLQKGFLDINNKNNNVNKNIEVLKYSNMPSFIAIAGHSGNGLKSYFKNLYKLSILDDIYIYYDNKKYHYQVKDIYEQTKNGTIEINKTEDSELILTDKTKQIIISAALINIT